MPEKTPSIEPLKVQFLGSLSCASLATLILCFLIIEGELFSIIMELLELATKNLVFLSE